MATMRIKKFRLSEGVGLIMMSVALVVASTSDLLAARSGAIAPTEMSVPAGYLAAAVCFIGGLALTRNAIERRR
jgi:hypothetical protein